MGKWILWYIRRDQKNSRFPGPRAPKNPSPRFFLVDLIHASHAFVLDFHARSIAPTTRVGRQASCRCSPHVHRKRYMKVMRETVSGGGSRYFAGSRYFMTPGPKLVHAIQHQIFKETKEKIRPPAPIPDNGCPGISNFFGLALGTTQCYMMSTCSHYMLVRRSVFRRSCPFICIAPPCAEILARGYWRQWESFKLLTWNNATSRCHASQRNASPAPYRDWG